MKSLSSIPRAPAISAIQRTSDTNFHSQSDAPPRKPLEGLSKILSQNSSSVRPLSSASDPMSRPINGKPQMASTSPSSKRISHGLAVAALESSPHIVVSGKSVNDGITLTSVDPSKLSRSSSSSMRFSPLSPTSISSSSTPSTLESMHDQLVKAFSELNMMETIPMKAVLPSRLDTCRYSMGNMLFVCAYSGISFNLTGLSDSYRIS